MKKGKELGKDNVRVAVNEVAGDADKPRHPELPGMPQKGKSALRAEECLAVMDDIANLKTRLEDRRESLKGQMKADKIRDIRVRSQAGILYEFRLEEEEKVRSKQIKEDF